LEDFSRPYFLFLLDPEKYFFWILKPRSPLSFHFSLRNTSDEKVQEEEYEAGEDYIYKFVFLKIDCLRPRRNFYCYKKCENINIMIGELYNCQSKFRFAGFYNI